MDGRQIRGRQLAQSERIKCRRGVWIVPSQTDSDSHIVDPHEGSCTCPDHETNGAVCKHVWAVRYVRHEVRLPDGTEVETEVLKPTYSQNWPRYNRAQCDEKAMVQALLRGLCEGIEQPPYKGRGRPPLPLADVVYGCVMKVYGGMSGRRASTDIEESRGRGHIDHAPHFNSIGNYLAREDMTPLLTRLIETSALPLSDIERSFSVDATGFATTTYDRWYDKKWGKDRKRARWVKAHCMVGNETNIITSIVVTDGDSNDCPEMPGLVQSTAQRFDVEKVQGDKAYLSHANLEAIEAVGAVPYIPFKVNSTPDGSTGGKGSEAWRRMWLLCQLHRDEFLQHYHQRSNSEATFSALKRKLGASVRSKKFRAQVNEVLCKVLAYNLTVITHSIYELGIETGFGAVEHAAE